MRQPDNSSNEILQRHLNVGWDKPISYLPIRTIEDVIGIPVATYVELIANGGNEYMIFDAEQSCIQSGAVYAFSFSDLARVLDQHSRLLSLHGWPSTPIDFIQRIASEWLDPGDPIMIVIRRSFGEE
jgi:hypothetical protein